MSEVEITRKYKDDKDIFYKKIEVKPVPEAAVSFDTDSTLLKTIAEAGTTDQLDTSTIESFTNLTQRRDKIYDSLDLMYNDSLVSAIVRSYCEDATETNEKGQIVWAESDDADTNSYINFLLKSLQVDKNVYSWVECLAKYGDVYLKLYRESDKKKFEDLFKEDVEEEARTPLNEDLIVHAYAKGDKLIDYLEMEKNPAELFELTKFGKTMGYIKADSKVTSSYKSELGFPNYKYKFKKGDIHIYDATKYAHASLDDLSGRIPEEVELFTTEDEWESDSTDYSFGVRRGQSLFYDAYKAWRELTLMENSMLLNRITKSSVTRVVQVEVGNMAPEEVPVKLMNVKSLMEQKTAINPGTSMDEYTMPGALENTVYVATYNGQGTITTSQVGGDIDVKGISDIDFFRQKFFGSMSVPSQYFGYCLRGNTQLRLLNGTTPTIAEMYANKDEYIGKGIMGCNQDGSLEPTKIKNIMLTRPEATFIRIHLDNGQYVDVTPDHRMMLRDGSFVPASDLKLNDSLMPFYNEYRKGRLFVKDNKTNRWNPQYRVVAEKYYEIPKGYQVHHINLVKADDDIENLIALSVNEHYLMHGDMLHARSMTTCSLKTVFGANEHLGEKMYHNAEGRYTYFKPGEEPEGWVCGGVPKSDEFKKVMSEKMTGKYLGVKNPNKSHPHTDEDKVKMSDARKAYFNNMSDEEREAYSQLRKECNWYNYHKEHPEAYMQHLINKHGEERIRKPYYTQCPVCGKMEERMLFPCEYEDYLNEDIFYYCGDECRNLVSGGGKLPRSRKLFIECGCNIDSYDKARWSGEYGRPDHFFKGETLVERLKYISDYTPACNHKVVGIEYLDVVEPCYDITVEDDCHTFALDAGIFVHNCDDAAGFSGGQSLAIISSRYGKAVKHLQACIRTLVTDIINMVLLDRKQDKFINKFRIMMKTPVTQEELDARDNISARMQIVNDIMNSIADIDDMATKLTILKSLLANTITDQDVINEIQKYIDKLESGEVTDDTSAEGDIGGDFGGGFSGGGADFGGNDDMNFDLGGPDDETNGGTDMGIEPGSEPTTDIGETDNAGGAPDLPSGADLGIDLTA